MDSAARARYSGKPGPWMSRVSLEVYGGLGWGQNHEEHGFEGGAGTGRDKTTWTSRNVCEKLVNHMLI
jgi:hypothetical protein